jgi:integrase
MLMATVNLLLRGKKNPANINVRFSNGRAMDFFTPINVFINPLHWDVKRQKIKNLIEVQNRDDLNSKFQKLKTYIIDEFNNEFTSGEIIDKVWIDKKISDFFNRPKFEVKKVNEPHNIYYSEFVDWWLKNKAKTHKTSKKSYLAPRAIQQYESFFAIVKKYELNRKSKLKLVHLSSEKINDFITFMENEQEYGEQTVTRHLGRFNFFCARAEESNISVNNNYKERFFVKKEEEVMEPYLNEDEINVIFKKDLSHDETLDNVRDNFIIGLWTGLRISDFNSNLNIDNIKEDYIEIKTEKTGTWVNIPIHPMVKSVLNKRFGMLPARISDPKFNLHIKTICQICDIDQEMRGKLFDPIDKRNKVDNYKKYLLVSSHICRRSFATNLYGVVPNSVIQNVGGWATEKMMLHYIKKSKREHAEILSKTWKEKYQNK